LGLKVEIMDSKKHIDTICKKLYIVYMTEQNDEISLLDLVVVLLRQRRMILGVTIVSLILGLGYYFISVMFSLNPGQKNLFTAEVRFLVPDPPLELRPYYTFNAVGEAQLWLSNPVNVLEVLESVDTSLLPEGDEYSQLTFVQNEIIGKRLTYSYDGTLKTFSLRFSGPDGETVTQVVDLLYDEISNEIDIVFERTLGELRNNLQETTTLLRSTLGGLSAITTTDSTLFGQAVAMERALQSLVSFTNDRRYPQYRIANTTVFLEEGESIITILALFLLSGAFFGIFLAFILEYLRSIKNDPLSREKVRKAWALE